MWVASVQTNTASPNALINPTSPTHARSTSAPRRAALTQLSRRRAGLERGTRDHQHWHPLSWQSQLSTNQECLPPPASWCHSRSLCQANNHHRPPECACVWRIPHVRVNPLFLMSPELEWGIIKRVVSAAKGQSHKRLWWISFPPPPFILSFFFFILFKVSSHLSKLRK